MGEHHAETILLCGRRQMATHREGNLHLDANTTVRPWCEQYLLEPTVVS
jgi:hypothetical protein